MRVTVRFFARARDLAGRDALTVEVPSPATVAALRDQLGRELPALMPLLARSVLAVNAEFAGETLAIPEGAEVAVLPPVSGGQCNRAE